MFPPVATYNKLEAPPTLKLLSYLYPDLLGKLKRQDNRLQIYFALCGFFHKQEMFSSFSKCCCCCSVTELCLTLCDPWSVACQASLSFTISRSLLKIMFIGLVMLSNRLILCCPLLFLPSVFSSMRVFSSESALRIRWPIGASASASVLSMNSQGWSPLGLIGLIPMQSKGLSSIFFSTKIQKHQFFHAQPSLWSNSHICTWLLEKP